MKMNWTVGDYSQGYTQTRHNDIIEADIDLSRAGLSIFSGLLLTASFPNIGISPLVWIALVPLLLAIRGLSPFSGFRLGLLTGVTHYLSLAYWLGYTMNTYGGLPWIIAVPIVFLLAGYLALYIAVFCTVLCTFGRKPLVGLLLIPLLWVMLEYIRSFLLTGFPWGYLGHTQSKLLHMIQISDITGVYGISFLIVAVNAALFMGCLAVWKKTWFGAKVHSLTALGAVAGGAALLAGAWFYGDLKLKELAEMMEKSPKAAIVAVQGNIDQSQKWDQRLQQYIINKYIDLSLSARPGSSALFVWPETAAPFYFTYDEPLTRMLLNGVQRAGYDFLIGSPSFTIENEKVEYYNSAYLIRSDGTVAGKYDKVHLVPFGEYVPLKKYLPFLGKIVEHIGDFRSGEKGKTLLWGKTRLGILICFEIIFPELSRAAVKNGAKVLLNLTNDAWYGRTSAPYQHFSMAVFRAVENRRSLVRSANTGISAFIDPTGASHGETEIFIPTAQTYRVPLLNIQSCYTRYGDIFAMGCSLLAVWLLVIGVYLKRRGVRPPAFIVD
jgi:apolipoprotein N-acyltransferase